MGLGKEFRASAGWLGRQIGHVRSAIKQDVTGPDVSEKPAAVDTADEPVLWQQKTISQEPHPDQPELTLRRTIIDEVIPAKIDADKKND